MRNPNSVSRLDPFEDFEPETGIAGPQSPGGSPAPSLQRAHVSGDSPRAGGQLGGPTERPGLTDRPAAGSVEQPPRASRWGDPGTWPPSPACSPELASLPATPSAPFPHPQEEFNLPPIMCVTKT